MKTVVIFDIEQVKLNLIQSCIKLDAFHFLPYLLSPSVTVDFPNKVRFYSFFKIILKCAGEETKGVLELRIEEELWEKEDFISYNFYDEDHNFPRINLKVKECKDNLFIDLKPF